MRLYSKLFFTVAQRGFSSCVLPYTERINGLARLPISGVVHTPFLENNYPNYFKSKEELLPLIALKEAAKQNATSGLPKLFALDKRLSVFARDFMQANDISEFLKGHVKKILVEEKPYHNALYHWLNVTIDFYEEYVASEAKSEDELLSLIEKHQLDLDWVASELTKHNLQLNFEDLFAAVIALNLWPQKYTYDARVKTTGPNDRHRSEFIGFVEKIEALSIQRKGVVVNADAECQALTIWHKLLLSKAWTQVHLNGIGVPLSGWKFPTALLDKVANAANEDGGRRFFSKIVPSDLLDLCRILCSLRDLPGSFHKYYALYKLFEYVDYYSVDEVGVICKAFYSHAIKAPSAHPISVDLARKILQKMIDSADPIMDRSIRWIDDYIGPLMSKVATGTEIKQLQRSMLQSQNLSIGSLIRIAGLGNLEDTDERFCALLHEKLVDCSQSDLQTVCSPEISKLLLLLGMNYLRDDSGLIKKKMIERTKDIIETSSGKSSANALIMAQFAYHGIFDEDLCKAFLSDDRIFFTNSKGETELKRSLIYDNPSDILKSSLASFFGLLKASSPHAAFVQLSQKSAESVLSWYDILPPSKCHDFDDNPLKKIWITVGKSLPEIVKSVAGMESDDDPNDYIVETAILPYNGFTDYVFCLNGDDQLQRLPDSYRKESSCYVRSIPEEYKYLSWKTITFVYPQKMKTFHPLTHDHQLNYLRVRQNLGYGVNLFNFGCYSPSDVGVATEDLRSMVNAIIRKKVA